MNCLYHKNAKFKIYHVQNLKFKSKNCLISSRFAPINKKKIVSIETHAQSHGTEAPKNKATSPKIRSPRKNSGRQTKFRHFLALNQNDTSYFWGNIITCQLLGRYKGYEPSADRSVNKEIQSVKTTFNQACYVIRW
jgi:hypothetical protein